MNKPVNKRDNLWLEEKLYSLWENFFADIPRKNFVLIKFGRSSRRQLGSIKWANPSTRIKSIMKKKQFRTDHEVQDDKRITVITITRKFKDPSIPEYVVDATIAHELCHYTHGFSSPMKQKYRHPHQGGIVRKELENRGLGDTHHSSQKWIKENWLKYIRKQR